MYGAQRPIDIANQFKLEMDPRNPRLRLTVLTTLSDNKVEVAELLPYAKDMVAWIGEDIESLLSEFLENTVTDDAMDVAEENPDKDPHYAKGQYL